MKNLCLILALLVPGTAWAWHGEGIGYWDYHGSGRDYAYSQYVDAYYNYPGYREPYLVDDEEPYFSLTATPTPITPVGPPISQLLPPAPLGEFTVNIPNNHGGYTPVVIKQSGNGYIGPQGEYYPKFPTVAELKAIYGQ